MNEIVVDYPLRGEWKAIHTPAEKVPSHGTHQLAQTYAYDFIRLDWKKKGLKFHSASKMKLLFPGVKLSECYGWSENIYSPFDCEVVEARDGLPERNPVNFFRDMFVIYKNAFSSKINLHNLVGNYLILKGENCYALLAHAQTNSIKVEVKQKVQRGEILCAVGHSGNSTAPHLHFQLMDDIDLLKAKGLPCSFREYEVLESNGWVKHENSTPKKEEIIRYAK